MRRIVLIAFATLAWLLASPSLQLRDSGWVEVGATAAMAQEFKGIMVPEPGATPRTSTKKKAIKKHRSKRIGSSGLVTSNQPAKHPMQPITLPQQPDVTSTVTMPARDPRYPEVPTVPVIGPETSQDRVVRCTHQGALGGLPASQQGAYIHNCAF